MSLERSFASLGRRLDEITDNLSTALRKFRRSFAGLLPGKRYTLEAKTLTEDLVRDRYDVVERNNVRVTRNDDGTAIATYDDGSEQNEITTYDVDTIAERLIEEDDL